MSVNVHLRRSSHFEWIGLLPRDIHDWVLNRRVWRSSQRVDHLSMVCAVSLAPLTCTSVSLFAFNAASANVQFFSAQNAGHAPCMTPVSWLSVLLGFVFCTSRCAVLTVAVTITTTNTAAAAAAAAAADTTTQTKPTITV